MITYLMVHKEDQGVVDVETLVSSHDCGSAGWSRRS